MCSYYVKDWKEISFCKVYDFVVCNLVQLKNENSSLKRKILQT